MTTAMVVFRNNGELPVGKNSFIFGEELSWSRNKVLTVIGNEKREDSKIIPPWANGLVLWRWAFFFPCNNPPSCFQNKSFFWSEELRTEGVLGLLGNTLQVVGNVLPFLNLLHCTADGGNETIGYFLTFYGRFLNQTGLEIMCKEKYIDWLKCLVFR
jgi:hypothetical protein